MIEKFETCQTKSIAKQTNRDESLIIRSIDSTTYVAEFKRCFVIAFQKSYMDLLEASTYQGVYRILAKYCHF